MEEENIKAEEQKTETACEENACENNEKTCTGEEKKECGKKQDKKLKNELAEAKKLLEEEQKKNAELLDMYKRMAAEFDNYKKRTAKELDGRYKDAQGDTVKKFLPVADNFERAVKAEVPEELKAYTDGVEMIFEQLKGVMSDIGVKEIEALGKEFDPQLHNAVLHTEDENVGENVVVEVFEKGYTLGDKVLRYSIVKVAN